jgi:glycosyltransferase involved in cell wall biosynthesis
MSIESATGTTAYSSRGSAKRPARAATVLHLVRRLDHSGEARMAIEFAAALNDIGGRAAIAYHAASAAHELQRHGIQPVEIRLGGRAPFSGFGAAKRLAKLVADSEVEILHAHGLDLLLIARAAAAEAGAKLILGFYEDAARVARLSKRQRTALESADEIIVLSDLAARELLGAIPALRDRITVIPFGIDFSRFDPAQVSAHRVIQQAQLWRVPDDRPVVMLPGRFARARGHGALVEALSLIRDVDLRCIMVGPDADGPGFRHQLGKEIAALGLSDRVLLAEECRDMPAALMLADVVVAPHLEPGAHNRAVIEALALGRPIVASDFPVMRDMLSGNEMAWLAAPGDAMALSWAIREALGLAIERREELSRHIIDIMREHRSRERMCGAALDIYQRMRPGAAVAA